MREKKMKIYLEEKGKKRGSLQRLEVYDTRVWNRLRRGVEQEFTQTFEKPLKEMKGGQRNWEQERGFADGIRNLSHAMPFLKYKA